MNICKVEGCNKKVKGYGLCSKHYQRLKRNGDTKLRIEYNGPRREYPEEYKCWAAMRRRCLNKNHPAYNIYGGNDISICERWQGPHGFAHFLEDMGPKPEHGKTTGGIAKYTVDRIDNNKGYCKENCKWSGWQEQRTNQRRMSGLTIGVMKNPKCSTYKARFRGNGMNLQKNFKTKEEAIEQRKEWIKKYSQ